MRNEARKITETALMEPASQPHREAV